jgi:heterotetrameric sarcosine oxidase beta subunit
MNYSGFRVFWEGLTGNAGWKPAWRDPDPRAEYDIVIVGGGGHGLATAYYLAKEFGQRNIAVVEKGWIGSGNVGRNTTIVRSNYLLPGNEPFYEFSLKLWEGLEQDFNFNAMVSQRGIVNLYHSDAQRDAFARRGNAMRLAGADAVLLDQDGIRELCPFLDFDNARFPIRGGLWQPRGGTVRHDAVAWGYARGADKNGVDILQNCARGAMRVGLTKTVSTSSRIAKSPGFRSTTVSAKAWKRRAGRSVRRRSRSASRARRVFRVSSLLVPAIFMCRSPIKAASFSGAISTATTPTHSAATCPSSKMSARAEWLSCR